jgi:hypothetical protein
MPATPFNLILRAALRDVYPMVIRLFGVPDSLDFTDLDDIFHTVLGWDSGVSYQSNGLPQAPHIYQPLSLVIVVKLPGL